MAAPQQQGYAARRGCGGGGAGKAPKRPHLQLQHKNCCSFFASATCYLLAVRHFTATTTTTKAEHKAKSDNKCENGCRCRRRSRSAVVSCKTKRKMFKYFLLFIVLRLQGCAVCGAGGKCTQKKTTTKTKKWQHFPCVALSSVYFCRCSHAQKYENFRQETGTDKAIFARQPPVDDAATTVAAAPHSASSTPPARVICAVVVPVAFVAFFLLL